MRNYEEKIKKAYNNLLRLYKNKANLPNEEEFKIFCKDIKDIDNIDKLLNKIFKENFIIKVEDLITELNVIHKLSLIYGTARLHYEKEIDNGTENKLNPDIIIDNDIIVQIKHINKSCALKEAMENNSDDFFNIDDENQIIQSLKTACKVEKGGFRGYTLFVIQEISESADMDQEVVSNALYGIQSISFKHNTNGKLIKIENVRSNGIDASERKGFFYIDGGKNLYAHICAVKKSNKMLSDYDFIIRPNPLARDYDKVLKDILPFSKIYDANTYF